METKLMALDEDPDAALAVITGEHRGSQAYAVFCLADAIRNGNYPGGWQPLAPPRQAGEHGMNEQETQAAEVNRCLDAIEEWIRDKHPGDLDNPELAAPLTALRAAYAVPLAWHAGRHHWESHDGYPRHQHSLNGALTIRPGDTQLHFAHGPAFTGPDDRGKR